MLKKTFPAFWRIATTIAWSYAVALVFLLSQSRVAADDGSSMFVWPKFAPGETSLEAGTKQPDRPNEKPPVTRVVKIRRPKLDIFLPEKNPSGTALLILPGGGFGKVVPDKEGSEAAAGLNELGIAAFVLSYRTNEVTPKDEPAFVRPLQDAQRALRLMRANAEKWNLKTDRIGVLGFSAGGQVAAVLHTAEGKAAYESLDPIDEQPCNPDFSLLVYPWRVYDSKTDALLPQIRFTKETPPAFIVHTHDDASTSLGSVLIYAGLKRNGVSAELHVYQNGGHGYGMRAVPNSDIGTWPDRATDWLKRRGLTNTQGQK
jgi:acetyl esterase/lipase